MKKMKMPGKLSLNKETIAKLNNEQLNNIHGGSTGNSVCYGCPPSFKQSCATTCANGVTSCYGLACC